MKRYYSCVVDSQSIFYYQSWNLINSLIRRANVLASQIYVNYTPEVDKFFLDEIRNIGCNINLIERFGDGKYCNKIAQLDNQVFMESECVFLLDTDMIVLNEIHYLYKQDCVCGKIVDLPNPSIDILKYLYDLARFDTYPNVCTVDCGEGETFNNNLNGGLYVIPGRLVKPLSDRWKTWALFLLSNIKILEDAGKQNHVDQISFSMAAHEIGIQICNLPRKYNYPAHLPIKNSNYPDVLHYHRNLSKVGLITSSGDCEDDYLLAINDANQIISESFNNRIFWSFRYSFFPELGSGVGSRAENAIYKRTLLRKYEIEASPSILDIGCGDLEVIKELQLKNYVGVDISPYAISEAIKKRPEYNFILLSSNNIDTIPCAHTVLCMEVLIHQKAINDYKKVIELITDKTLARLIVSGYTSKQMHHETNHMLAFHENIVISLQNTGKFSRITVIGSHSDVVIVLAEV